jgi:type IV pilus assembly protein PilE
MHRHPCPRPAGGFTLIEVVIAIVVVALLSVVAFPSFLDAIRKGRRADAFTAINAIQQAQERHRANNAAYSTSITGAVNASPPGLALASSSSSEGYYSLAIDAAAVDAYTITATAVSGKSQVNDTNCQRLRVVMSQGTLSYESSGTSGSFVAGSSSRCWAR